MSKLNKDIQNAYIRLKNEAIYGIYGKRYIPSNDDGTVDNTQDFPYLEDPTDYVTHIPLEQEEIEEAEKDPTAKDIKDLEKELENKEEEPEEEMEETPEEEETEEPEEEMPTEETPEMPGGDVDADQAANDINVGASPMPGTEPEQTSTQLGRIYELKKIYSRLSSVEIFLSRTTDDNILEIRKMVSNSIDLFELVISNFEQYKEKIDEIIVTYYEFLKVVYESIKKHFRKTSKQQE